MSEKLTIRRIKKKDPNKETNPRTRYSRPPPVRPYQQTNNIPRFNSRRNNKQYYPPTNPRQPAQQPPSGNRYGVNTIPPLPQTTRGPSNTTKGTSSITNVSRSSSRKSAWRARQYFKNITTKVSSSTSTFSTVHVIPPAQLSLPELALLSKGLKFIPYNSYTEKHKLQDTHRLRQYLIKQTSKYRYDLPKNTFYYREPTEKDVPASSLTAINQFMSNMDQAASNLNAINILRDKLNRRQRSTLNTLSKRKDIIIRKSDKGDTIVVETLE